MRLEELEGLSQDPDFWNDTNTAKIVSKEKSILEDKLNAIKEVDDLYEESATAFELLGEGEDADFIDELKRLLPKLEESLNRQEFLCKMSGRFDQSDAILEINGGSGGTEAQDWAEMLLRMYLRWADKSGFDTEELDYLVGEVAGIKSATILVKGPYAYGYLRSEQGVHRLVRISPFDSGARRHTSFASVSVTPDIEEDIEIEIDDKKDLRVDTYRAGGKGGQHVNKTDSAVRLTHIPTGIVVACQNERSQHKNKERAMKILKAKLYELERQKQADSIASIKGERRQIDFGSQIRSYVMQPYQMVKDLRTNYETSNVQGVLDGDLDEFIESYLLSKANQEAI